MSKRDEGSNIGEYMRTAFVPAAVRNYLCLLGWSPKDDREILPIEEVVRLFDLGNINRANARFDLKKLAWMNGQYLRAMPAPALRELAHPLLAAAGLVHAGTDPDYTEAGIGLFREKLQRADELPGRTIYFFRDDYPVEPDAAARLAETSSRENILLLIPAMESLGEFSAATTEATVRALAAQTGQKAAAFIHPCRAAVSGSTAGPSLFHMLEVIGRERVLGRLRSAAA
jgi:glutamyl/glutaminyl-tRNA synthetase